MGDSAGNDSVVRNVVLETESADELHKTSSGALETAKYAFIEDITKPAQPVGISSKAVGIASGQAPRAVQAINKDLIPSVQDHTTSKEKLENIAKTQESGLIP